MFKRTLSVILIFLVVCCFTTSCAKDEEVVPYDSSFVEALDFFVSYIESTRVDWKQTVEEYMHFEDEENRQNTMTYGTPTLSYEIIRIEKLSDKLWEIEYFITSEDNKYGFYCANYVGIIDGRYRAMSNVIHIPSELSEGIEIEPYKPHGPGIVG